MDKSQNTAQMPSNSSLMESLFSVGAHFGFIKSRRHPTSSSFIFGSKNKIDIFDLEKTSETLEKALEFVKAIASRNGLVLFIGGKNEAKEAVTHIASAINQPYVAGRFIGGSLTNFPEIKKRIDKLEMLVSQKEKGELVKYTKKERLLIDREIAKLREFFFGLSIMKSLPQAVFVIDAKRESIAVEEARKMNIPVIALCGSDNDLAKVDFPIPGNDSSKASIEFFLKKIAEAYRQGQMTKPKA